MTDSLVQQAINPLVGKYYRPENPEPCGRENWVCGNPHIIRVRGPVGVFSTETRALLGYDLFEKDEKGTGRFQVGKGLWFFVSDQRVELKTLLFYREVQESELPWNNGERFARDALPRLSREDIEAWIVGRETVRRRAEESREARSA